MCEVLDRAINKGIQQGREEGYRSGQADGVRMERERNVRMLSAAGLTLQDIANALQIDLQSVQQILA